MRIIENKHSKQITCDFCGSIIEVEESDIDAVNKHDERIYIRVVFRFKCIACCHYMEIDHKLIPVDWVKARAKFDHLVFYHSDPDNILQSILEGISLQKACGWYVRGDEYKDRLKRLTQCVEFRKQYGLSPLTAEEENKILGR